MMHHQTDQPGSGRIPLPAIDFGAAAGSSEPFQEPPPPPSWQPPYLPPPYAPPAQQTNGFAIASLVLGITGVAGVGFILAIVFGVLARKQIKESGGRQSGDGLALAGLILGIIGVASVIVLLAVIIAADHTPWYRTRTD